MDGQCHAILVLFQKLSLNVDFGFIKTKNQVIATENYVLDTILSSITDVILHCKVNLLLCHTEILYKMLYYCVTHYESLFYTHIHIKWIHFFSVFVLFLINIKIFLYFHLKLSQVRSHRFISCTQNKTELKFFWLFFFHLHKCLLVHR